MKYRVIYDRPSCIGAGTCVAAMGSRWKISDDGKADLKGSHRGTNGQFELIIDESELQKMLDAAQTCPVQVIHVEELETGKRLV